MLQQSINMHVDSINKLIILSVQEKMQIIICVTDLDPSQMSTNGKIRQNRLERRHAIDVKRD